MLENFAIQDRQRTDEIRTVLSRWDQPSPYRSFSEYRRTLADAYQARAEFWESVIDYAIGRRVPSVLFSALLDARHGCADRADQLRREARESAQFDQEQAFRSYSPNIQAAQRPAEWAEAA